MYSVSEQLLAQPTAVNRKKSKFMSRSSNQNGPSRPIRTSWMQSCATSLAVPCAWALCGREALPSKHILSTAPKAASCTPCRRHGSHCFAAATTALQSDVLFVALLQKNAHQIQNPYLPASLLQYVWPSMRFRRPYTNGIEADMHQQQYDPMLAYGSCTSAIQDQRPPSGYHNALWSV